MFPAVYIANIQPFDSPDDQFVSGTRAEAVKFYKKCILFTFLQIEAGQTSRACKRSHLEVRTCQYYKQKRYESVCQGVFIPYQAEPQNVKCDTFIAKYVVNLKLLCLVIFFKRHYEDIQKILKLSDQHTIQTVCKHIPCQWNQEE